MLMPNGEIVGDISRPGLVAIWATDLRNKMAEAPSRQKPLIFAALGRPTYPANLHAVIAAKDYWEVYLKKVKAAAKIQENYLDDEVAIDKIVKLDAAINYGNFLGEFEPRQQIATVLSNWYGTAIQADEILFTVGGVSGLKAVFAVVNKRTLGGSIITPCPYYSFYADNNNQNKLHLIDVMQEPGYRLTAQALQNSINEFLKHNTPDKMTAFLFCMPNNPLGTVLTPTEWQAIAEVLQQYPKVPIILDEAYAELQLNGEKYQSLLEIAPTLKPRIILMRSGTKGFSTAGERMALLVAFDTQIMQTLREYLLADYFHCPISLQYAYTAALQQLDQPTLKKLNRYYAVQINLLAQELARLKLLLPDPLYRIDGSFYVIGNFSELLGWPLCEEAKYALADENQTGVTETDQDIAYNLLFKEKIALCPMSYFGVDAKLGYLRITACGGIKEIKEIINRLEKLIMKVRSAKPKK